MPKQRIRRDGQVLFRIDQRLHSFACPGFCPKRWAAVCLSSQNGEIDRSIYSLVKRMENPTPSSLLVSVIDAACQTAMQLKKSKKQPFTCLILRVERGKTTYDIVPVYAPNYEMSVKAARQQASEWRPSLMLYAIVSDGNIRQDGKASDAIIIEASEVEQRVIFQFVRRYTPPNLFSKARSEERLTLVKYETAEGNPAHPAGSMH